MALFDWGKKSKLNKIKQELDNFVKVMLQLKNNLEG